ncbi:hypothetical protein [Francisella sp. 19X1-34]|uniref:hypothetical protein n=1 Tax=Francisella sp. 19X1-34 TaxID=3087177 RepID=UPI002E36D7FE|nr:hypothetical protein [Francisella sp. 19X1-34]MED7789492.1 hypothetical protein [Francisella sp. 19X1-34]
MDFLIYKSAFHNDSQFSLNYQWALIIFLSSWGAGSLFAGALMNRYGAYLGIILGYVLATVAFILLLLDINHFIFVISALLMGLSLSFLMLDGVITYFEQNTYSISVFRRYVIQLTFFSGFASTFTYFFVSPIFIYIGFKIAVIIVIFITITLLVLSNFSLSKVYFKKETKLLGNIYKSLVSRNSLAIIAIMLSQGTVQTIIFFEVFIFLQSKNFDISFVLTRFCAQK